MLSLEVALLILILSAEGIESLHIFTSIIRRLGFGGPKMPVAGENTVSSGNAVLVIGGTGRTGRQVVRSLLAESSSSTNVVVGYRNESKLAEAFDETELKHPRFDRKYIDLTQPDSIASALNGISQVISCAGPSMITSSENVDYKGTTNLIRELLRLKDNGGDCSSKPLLRFDAGAVRSETMSLWSRLDDVIMGGRSSSGWTEVDWNGEGLDFMRWTGQAVVEGGGFCGTVIREYLFDSDGFDGVSLILRGDGNRYKFRLKPVDMVGRNEYQYQAAFDTVAGMWITVRLPWSSFVAVRRNDVIYGAPKVNAGSGKMGSLGLTYSRFEFDELPNPKFRPGIFALDVKEIGVYRKTRPAFILISSAGTERINTMSSPDETARDIPIVQLNPKGILNWKYKAEQELRLSGLPYTIIRATGIIDDSTDIRRVQAFQGDRVVGRVTPREIANVVAGAMKSAYSEGKTIEITRDETGVGLNDFDTASLDSPESCVQDVDKLFRFAVRDSDRVVSGLPPLPLAKDPFPPLSPERIREILNNPL